MEEALLVKGRLGSLATTLGQMERRKSAMSRLTDEQIEGIADDFDMHDGYYRFARAIESAVLNASVDQSGAVGKGVQPPDGTTVRAVVVELYPEWGNGYAQTADGSRFLINEGTRGLPLDALRIGDPLTILELSNRGYVVRAEREAAEPSMSTTSPSADSGTDALKDLEWREIYDSPEGGAKP